MWRLRPAFFLRVGCWSYAIGYHLSEVFTVGLGFGLNTPVGDLLPGTDFFARLEAELAEIREQLSRPETGADYQLLQDLCAQQEEKESQLSLAMDRWVELAEREGGTHED